jgi:signal transduction histidine kinase
MTGVEILTIVSILMLLMAIVMALLLVNHTKYKALWVCCVVGLTMLTMERIFDLGIFDREGVSNLAFAWINILISVSYSLSVLFAYLLVRHVDRVTQQRRELENRLMTAVLRTEERQRATFSRELHDGLGPLLSSAKMSLSALNRTDLDDKSREMLHNTSAVIDEAIRSLREISNNLSPHVLNNFGLVHGIKNFVERVGAMHNREIEVRTRLGDERFDSNIEVILYRVVCELVNNSLKHSACDRIVLELNKVGKNIVIDYRDNGKGFNLEEVESVGMGLSNIKSRISSLGGKIRFDSKPGSGMLAHIEVSTTGEIVQLAEDLYEQVYGKRYGRKKSKRSVGR